MQTYDCKYVYKNVYKCIHSISVRDRQTQSTVTIWHNTALTFTRLFQIQQFLNKLGVELIIHMVFPGGSEGKVSACNVGDVGSIPGRSPGEGNGNPLQHSCLENPVDGGAW